MLTCEDSSQNLAMLSPSEMFPGDCAWPRGVAEAWAAFIVGGDGLSSGRGRCSVWAVQQSGGVGGNTTARDGVV